MTIPTEKKAEIMREFGMSDNDTGSSYVQIALLTERISTLSEHLQANKLDHHGRRGLLTMVGRRKRLLRYLEQTDFEGYRKLIQRLGLRR
ncbi:MAG: 30S ribosomal protein S15 [Trueperaceae bacterium]|nr:30S ribosomal protein S15 [Trueperaceae bacterium]